MGQSATGFGQDVKRSGAVYHVEVCPGPASPGTARCHAHIVTDAKGNPIAKFAAPNVTPSGYGPANLWSAYPVFGQTGPVLPSSSQTFGPIIAVVDAYGYTNAESDLNVYRAQFGLGTCTTANGCFAKYNQKGTQGNYPRQNTGWAQESALDLQMASAMCPTCKVILVEANSANFSDLNAAVGMAKNLGAIAISNSYGGGEQGTSEGNYGSTLSVVVTASSGDSGYGVSFPASATHVIAVGGTSLTTAPNARGWSETAWSGAGSGCSSLYSKPNWQTDAGCVKRSVADVAALADPAHGVAVFAPTFGHGSGWFVFGGTSVAAPLIAGIYGAKNGLGSSAAFCTNFPSAYGCELYENTTSLNDVTSGANGSCGGSYLCTAGTAYDGPTGVGTPKALPAF
jgi:hypothetical protein